MEKKLAAATAVMKSSGHAGEHCIQLQSSDDQEPVQQCRQKLAFVLADREREGAEPSADRWDAREFNVKWKRWSYMHTSWETREALSQLGGFKRVLNYIKRVDEAEVRLLHPRANQMPVIAEQETACVIGKHPSCLLRVRSMACAAQCASRCDDQKSK